VPFRAFTIYTIVEETRMSIFSAIMDKVFHRANAAQSAAQPAERSLPQASAPAVTAAPVQAPAQAVDVEAVLTRMASQKGGGGNWQTSIVDLLKLLELDSSLDARKQLAGELGVHAGADGSAEQNIALHKAVMRKLAENGGKVPDSLKD
jgi:hypothetical protein